MKRNTNGLGLISGILVLTLVAACLAGFGLLLTQERARVRDARRMVDMVRVQYAFETLYRERASYVAAGQGCATVGSSVSACTLAAELQQIATMKDPNGRAYLVTRVPDETDFGVSFTLERGYDGLAAGKHTVSRSGIQ